MNKITPILIAAKNEEASIIRTLQHIVQSIINYQRNLKKNIENMQRFFLKSKLTSMIFPILICDNNSSDKTIKKILEFKKANYKKLVSHNIDIIISKELAPGKLNSLKNLIQILEKKFDNCYESVIFTDAEVVWSDNIFSLLINYKLTNSDKQLVGANIVPYNKNIGIWGELEIIPYYGYGQNEPYGHGKFFKFISGMCYLADKRTLHYLKTDIPSNIGNEDVALSLIIGVEKIAIIPDAIVYYNTVESFKQFAIIRGRHIRELFRIKRWLINWKINQLENEFPRKIRSIRDKYAVRWAKKRFFLIAEYRTIPFIIGFYQSSKPFKLSKNGISNWFRNIPAVRMNFFKFTLFVFPFALSVYFFLKLIVYIQSFIYQNPGWEPYRCFNNSSLKRTLEEA